MTEDTELHYVDYSVLVYDAQGNEHVAASGLELVDAVLVTASIQKAFDMVGYEGTACFERIKLPKYSKKGA